MDPFSRAPAPLASPFPCCCCCPSAPISLSSTFLPGFFVWSSRRSGRLVAFPSAWRHCDLFGGSLNQVAKPGISVLALRFLRTELDAGHGQTWDEPLGPCPNCAFVRHARSIFSSPPTVPDRRRISIRQFVSPPCSTRHAGQRRCHRRPPCAQNDLMHGALDSPCRGSRSNIKSPNDPVFLAIGQFGADGSGMAHWRRLFQTEN